MAALGSERSSDKIGQAPGAYKPLSDRCADKSVDQLWCVFGELDQPLSSGLCGCFTPGRRLEAGKYCRNMVIDGLWRNEELFSNLAVGQPLIEQPQNIDLAVC